MGRWIVTFDLSQDKIIEVVDQFLITLAKRKRGKKPGPQAGFREG